MPLTEELLKLAAEKGVLIPPEVRDELSNSSTAEALRNLLLSRSDLPMVVTREMITPKPQQTVGHINSQPGEVKVTRDVTGKSTSTGDIRDFAKYFTDRFRSLKRILQKRADMSGAIPISRAIGMDRDVRVIGMVNSVHATRNGNKVLEIEDEEERCSVLLLNTLASESILKDEVIGVAGRMSRERKAIIASSISRPDVPFIRERVETDSSSKLAVLSDIHVGSRTFLRKEWSSLIEWLKTDPEAREINYILISGDLADGIGVYPNQEEDLELDDIYAQYQRVADYLLELPDWMKVIIIPGNHDAVRPAEPQPALQQELQRMFAGKVVFAGNPSSIEIEGRRLLAYHGRSFDDVISSIPHLGWDRPIQAMEELLKRRHLAPVYGEKTPLAPESMDYMVIDQVPDIFVTGHIHSFGLSEYRGVRLISGSTWQAQTSYQKMRNISPIPAKMPICELSSLSLGVVNFSDRYTPRFSRVL